MNWRLFGALSISAWLSGCTTGNSDTGLSIDHPANPEAAVTPARPPTTTLAVNLADRPTSSGGTAATAGGGSAEGAGQAAGHAGHSAPSSPSAAPAASPGVAPAGQNLFVCPMHAEVVSADPNARCPKCMMKINKPKPATASQAPAGAQGHTGHGAHEGGR